MDLELPPIDASDPGVKITLGGISFSVPLWQTTFDIEDIKAAYYCTAPRQDGTRCGECAACKSPPHAWLQDLKKLLHTHGGPAVAEITDGEAFTFWESFDGLSLRQQIDRKKKRNEMLS